MSVTDFTAEYNRLLDAEHERNKQIDRMKLISNIALLIAFLCIVVVSYLALIKENPNAYLQDLFVSPLKHSYTYLMIIYISTIMINIYYRNKMKEDKKIITLTLEEALFLRMYELNKYLLLVIKEDVKLREEHNRKKAIDCYNSIIKIFNDIKIGNLKIVKDYIEYEIEEIIYGFETVIYKNLIKGDKESLKMIINLMNEFIMFALNPSIDTLKAIKIKELKKLPKIQYEEENIMKRMNHLMHEYYPVSRIIFSILIALFTAILAHLFNLQLYIKFTASLTSFWGSINYFDKIIPKKEHKNNEIHIEQKQEIITKKIVDKDIVHYDFEDEILNKKPSGKWVVETTNQGKVYVTNEVDGALHSNKCLKIESNVGSNSIIILPFEKEVKMMDVDYYLRQKINSSGNNNGTPFIVESPTSIEYEAIGNRTLYMEIINGFLRHGIRSNNKILCKIDADKWYHILLHIDCKTKMYKIEVEGIIQDSGKIFEGHDTVYKIRNKHFNTQREWTTYIDEIKYKIIE